METFNFKLKYGQIIQKSTHLVMSSFLNSSVPAGEANSVESATPWPEHTFCTAKFAARLLLLSVVLGLVCAWLRMRMPSEEVASAEIALESHRMHFPVQPGTLRPFLFITSQQRTIFSDESEFQQNIQTMKQNLHNLLPSTKW